MVEILSDKIVNSAEGTNLLIEEGPQTIDLRVFFKYHEVCVKNHKIFVIYRTAAPRKRDLCKLVRKVLSRAWALWRFSDNHRWASPWLSYTHLHKNKERIRNCLKNTCTKTNKGLEIVLNTLAPKQGKGQKCLTHTCTKTKERIRNCHKQTCAKTKKGIEIVLDTQLHQNKEKIINCLKHTCNKTKTGLEIVLNTLTPKQRKLWKLS